MIIIKDLKGHLVPKRVSLHHLPCSGRAAVVDETKNEQDQLHPASRKRRIGFSIHLYYVDAYTLDLSGRQVAIVYLTRLSQVP